jgi:hypothetical protein
MDHLLKQNFPLYFPLFFVLLWITITTLLGFLSGWFALARTYPDRDEAAIQVFAGQSGSMGMVSMGGVLRLSVCPGGLRLGMLRILGPFCRTFFVPWNELSVVRKDRFLMKAAQIEFGQPVVGTLTIAADVADRLARAAAGHWPETDPITNDASGEAGARILKQWVVTTILASLFFIVATRIMLPPQQKPPSAMLLILFPATVFGINAIVRYVRSRRP